MHSIKITSAAPALMYHSYYNEKNITLFHYNRDLIDIAKSPPAASTEPEDRRIQKKGVNVLLEALGGEMVKSTWFVISLT